jgi:hypothetical protein
MDTKMLLRFLTASDLMLYNSEGNFFKIQVKIVDLEGIDLQSNFWLELFNSNLCEIHDPDIGIQHSIHFALENLVQALFERNINTFYYIQSVPFEFVVNLWILRFLCLFTLTYHLIPFFYFIHTMLGLLGIWVFQFIVIQEILTLLAV